MAKNLWEEFKNLFKTDEQLAKERQDAINDALEKEKDILGQLSEIEKEYNDSLPKEEKPQIDFDEVFPKDSGLKEIVYQAESDDDIEKRSLIENDFEKSKELNKLESKYGASASALEKSKEKAATTLAESYRQLEKLYDELRENVNNDTIKRGMARSSVATTRMDGVNEAHMQGMSELEKSYSNTMNDLNASIEKLMAERETALSELDIKYALKLDERISELKAERDEAVKKYDTYNYNVRHKNSDYAAEREKNIAEYKKIRDEEEKRERERQEEYEKKYGYSGDKKDNFERRYEIAFDFYSSLSPDIAYDALLASPSMKYYLGQYYDQLKDTLKKTNSNASNKSKKVYY